VRKSGFQIVHFEELSFMEQATLCSRAHFLIGNHGAGLTNMLFMASGGSVLEFRKKADAKNNCYFSLASALGLDYFYQTCSSDTPEEDPNTADIIVDVSALERNLDLMLGRPRAVSI
jgi:capsular polysaccharide biosynthesis protein